MFITRNELGAIVVTSYWRNNPGSYSGLQLLLPVLASKSALLQGGYDIPGIWMRNTKIVMQYTSLKSPLIQLNWLLDYITGNDLSIVSLTRSENGMGTWQGSLKTFPTKGFAHIFIDKNFRYFLPNVCVWYTNDLAAKEPQCDMQFKRPTV